MLISCDLNEQFNINASDYKWGVFRRIFYSLILFIWSLIMNDYKSLHVMTLQIDSSDGMLFLVKRNCWWNTCLMIYLFLAFWVLFSPYFLGVIFVFVLSNLSLCVNLTYTTALVKLYCCDIQNQVYIPYVLPDSLLNSFIAL